MAILLHGTTRLRAEQIVREVPRVDTAEPGDPKAFWMYRQGCSYDLGRPEQYALAKSALFPDEGGAVILAVDVPDKIIAIALDEFFTWEQGIIPFEMCRGLEQLQAAWSILSKEITPVPSA